MDPARVACVELPALPLQLALRARPEWRARPVVVVDRPGPCGQVLFVNDVGRRLRIPIGARLPAASAIAPGSRPPARSPRALQVAPLILAALAEARARNYS
ncbi:MAG: hypothetical protein R3A51_19815 [Nannocystaceae bacterium]